MLKIKDNVDLKELEKYGFRKLKLWCEGDYNMFLKPDNYINEKCDMAIYVENRKIGVANYTECIDWEIYMEVLYDLIKADLVEKVGDKE